MYLVMHFLTLAIYFVGANLIEKSVMANKLVLFGDMVVFSSYAITNIGKLFVYIIIYKVRFSNVDESLKKIISDMRFKKDELVLLIKPSILNALIMCEEYSVEKKFPKHGSPFNLLLFRRV